MLKRVIIRNGKKYIVNVVSWDSCDEAGVGPGAPAGTLLMQSITDGLWYEITLTGTSGSAVVSVNQTASAWKSPGQDFGYQLVLGGGGSVYQVYLSGSAGSVVIKTAAWPLSGDYKPCLRLLSNDGNFYNVNISGSSLLVDQNSKWWPSWPNATPPYSLYY